MNMSDTIGTSDYSNVFTYEGNEGTPPLVEKVVSGIGTYFVAEEKRINSLISSIDDPTGRKRYIIKYYGESDRGGLLFERAKSNLSDAPLLSPNEFAQMIRQILQGIEFLDQHRILHRDLHRIENIYIFENDDFKIGDFGLSKIEEESSDGNLNAFATAIYIYIGDRILGLGEVLDSMADVEGALLRSTDINPKIKEALLDFIKTSSNITTDHFVALASILESNEFIQWNN